MKLYPILSTHRELLRQIEANDGELTPEMETALRDVTEDINESLSSTAYTYKTLVDEATVIDAEIKRLTAWKSRLNSSAETIKGYISLLLEMNGLTEVKHNNIRLSYRRSKAVEITDMEMLPDIYKVVKCEANKLAIKDAISKGEHVKGAELVEKLNLQIK